MRKKRKMKPRDPKVQAFIDGIQKRADHLASIRVFERDHKKKQKERDIESGALPPDPADEETAD